MTRFAWCLRELVRLAAIAGWIAFMIAVVSAIAPGRTLS